MKHRPVDKTHHASTREFAVVLPCGPLTLKVNGILDILSRISLPIPFTSHPGWTKHLTSFQRNSFKNPNFIESDVREFISVPLESEENEN